MEAKVGNSLIEEIWRAMAGRVKNRILLNSILKKNMEIQVCDSRIDVHIRGAQRSPCFVRQLCQDSDLDGVIDTDDEIRGVSSPGGVSVVPDTPVSDKGLKSKIRRHHLTSDVRASLLVEFVNRDLCNRFGVNSDYVARLKAAYDKKTEGGADFKFSRKVGSGRPRVITPEMAEFLVDWAATEMFEFTYEEAARQLGVDRTTVSRYMHSNGWRNVLKGVRPFLTEAHMKARMAWVEEHFRNSFEDWVDIDEKWFFSVSRVPG